MNQFQECLKTIPNNWQILVLTDTVKEEIHTPIVSYYSLYTPTNVYEMLTERKNILKYINLIYHNIGGINHFDRIWYSDPDILFTGDILKKYENNDNILLAYEPNCTILHPCMAGGFDALELKILEQNHAPCINGGFWSVPKSKYNFFEQYKTLCNFFESKWPNDMSTDQHVLNNLYHRGIIKAELFDIKDVVFRPNETGEPFGLVNHYIGMNSDKLGVMQSELKRMQ